MATQDENVEKFIKVLADLKKAAAAKSRLEGEKRELQVQIAKDFGESGTTGLTVNGVQIHLQKFVTGAANEGYRPALIEIMKVKDETKDLIKPGLHGGSFNSWIAGHDELGMMTEEELHASLPEWMQPLVHVNSSTIAIGKKAKGKS